MSKFQRKQYQSVTPHISLTQPIGHLTYTQGGTTITLPGVTNTTPKRHAKAKRIVKWTAIILAALIIVTGGWLGWKLYRNVSKVTGDNNPLHLFSSVPLKNTDGRVNILLAGYSNDDPGHDGATLTDSIMVASINQTDNTAQIISIPRDLWVKIPNHGSEKINAAYYFASTANGQEESTSDGMAALQTVTEEILGIDIHYYALINYTAFKDAVNAVGGITVDLTSEDNPYGLYDPYTNLKLPNSVVNLDGQTALNLARSRGDGPGAYGFPRSDFNRTEHQRKMLIALQQKATTSGVLANPLKIAELADAAGSNVKSSLKTNELQSLAQQLKKIESTKISSVGLNDVNGKNLLKSYAAPNGSSALSPAAGVGNYSAIHTAIDALFAPAPTATTPAQPATSTQ